MTVSRASLTYIDNSKEKSSFQFAVEQITSLNRDNVTAGIATIQSAADAMTLGAPSNFNITDTNIEYPYTVPNDEAANREMAVEFTMQDVVNPKNKTRVSLPAPNLSLFPFVEAQSDVVEFPYAGTISTELQTLINALEDEVVHPISEQSVTVIRIKRVGRNL